MSRLYPISCPEQSFRQTLRDLAPSTAPCCEPQTKQVLPQLSPIKELACRQADTIRENHGNSPPLERWGHFQGKGQGLGANCSMHQKHPKPTTRKNKGNPHQADAALCLSQPTHAWSVPRLPCSQGSGSKGNWGTGASAGYQTYPSILPPSSNETCSCLGEEFH